MTALRISTRNRDEKRLPKVERLSALTPRRRNEILSRSTAKIEEIRPLVKRIMDDVRRNDDAAVTKYTRKFDGITLSPSRIRVTRGEIKRAYRVISRDNPDLLPAMQTTLECIRAYHEGELAQLRRGVRPWERLIRSRKWDSSAALRVGQLRRPIDRVGIYVPGGNAVLLTTALMGVTPAKVAGVPDIVVASPPSRNGDIDPRIVAAADLAGADLIVRAGGIQAIAAMAYGTESVPAVAKIIGPGNIFVAAAKAYVAGNAICAIDLPAGPSEILIIADDSANIEYVARDMLSQSEHDTDACAVLVTTSKRVADGVRARLASEFGDAGGRPSIAEQSLSRYGALIFARSLRQAVAFANEFAPEHLEIMTRKPRALLDGIRNAGGIFLGNYSPTAVGDYVCPNHILPTGRAARFTAGLSVDTFMKKPSVLEAPRNMMKTLEELVGVLSKAEGLYEQHGASLRVRARHQKTSNSATRNV